MANYRVVFEIEVEADTPLEAAKTAEEWLQNPNNHWQYYVQNTETNEVNSVDLDEGDSEAVLPADGYQPMIRN